MAKTKKDIEAENEALQERIKELEEMNQRQAALLSAVADEEGGGWVITTRNARYNGVTAGVAFAMGRAFIPDGNEPDKARFTAKMLIQDFGYNGEHLEAEEVLELRSELEEEGAGQPISEDLLDLYSPAEMMGDDEI